MMQIPQMLALTFLVPADTFKIKDVIRTPEPFESETSHLNRI